MTELLRRSRHILPEMPAMVDNLDQQPDAIAYLRFQILAHNCVRWTRMNQASMPDGARFSALAFMIMLSTKYAETHRKIAERIMPYLARTEKLFKLNLMPAFDCFYKEGQLYKHKLMATKEFVEAPDT